MNRDELKQFIAESNRIEGITRPPLNTEVNAFWDFLLLKTVSVTDLCALVEVFAPRHRLRNMPGLDVRVGKYYPPPGGAKITGMLMDLLEQINRGQIGAYEAHLKYEALHPFTDGNGRSGRALWLWQMGGEAPLGFLHKFYYQTLDASDRK